jgi:uncharacterized protein (DUF2147 family)
MAATRADTQPRGGWQVYAPIIPLALIQIFLRPYWPGVQNLYDDWANVAYYSTYLLLGALLASRPSFEQAVVSEERRALVVSVTALAALLGAVAGILTVEWLVLALTAVAGWSFTVFLLGVARRIAPASSSALGYFAEASMPIYVLHQPAIVFVAWSVIAWPCWIGLKYVVILLGSLAATLATYHALVRPIQLLRISLGMKRLAYPPPRTLSRGITASLLLLTICSTTAAASTVPSPIGVWWAEGGAAQVRVEPCTDTTLCGRVVWLRSPFDEDGCMLRDRFNADPALRTRDMLGLEIVRDLTADPVATEWSGGTIYDPTSGRTYQCAMRLRDQDRLEIRGYLGFRVLGRTVTWTRVGSEQRSCHE